MPEEQKPAVKQDDNTVKVGTKPIQVYVNAIQQKIINKASEIPVLARGHAIKTAIDAVERIKRTSNWKITKMCSGTDELKRKEGEKGTAPKFVSTLEIILKEGGEGGQAT